ncbi:heme ABC transporter ATP-binding protein [Wenzhouxiangella sp. XN24]|uniref:heme ABC transporter ATP-binding protein n=1 Tax=Wenzhouxiangella sp. XN24 TaxID=2713569 RepID=UPI0013EC5F8F|nr:heme ABC transporter ATP-binding protein [Wenzhouxiangella sp. XN24]NGX16364.1 heme ABC transporter ATP-binding protein [Wenzhouxiangella sp. XN24]
MLHATRLEVSLSQRPILRDVEFRARPGQLTAIVGPNGSGKTTLLRALTGETPFTGRVELDGDDITALKPWQLAARRAVLPQATRLAFPFTVLEVVRIGLSCGRDGGRERLAEAALARVGLSGFEGRLFHELSGGEQQRTQLARVLVQVWNPVVDGLPCWLFLDEPVASLDIGQQLEVMRLAREFATAGGGVIAVMHDLNLTAMFADSVAIMREGHLMQQGPPGEVLTDGCLSTAYGCRVRVNVTPSAGAPFLLPHACVETARFERSVSAP